MINDNNTFRIPEAFLRELLKAENPDVMQVFTTIGGNIVTAKRIKIEDRFGTRYSWDFAHNPGD